MGFRKGFPRTWKKSRTLIINSFLNETGKFASRVANQTAAAVLLYIFVSKSINFVFFEELEGKNEYISSAIFGGLTGLVYKGFRGRNPALLSSFIGCFAAMGLVHLYRKGYLRISFQV